MDATFDELSGQEETLIKEESYEQPFAGFWMRFWAYIADLIIVGSIMRLFVNPIFNLLNIEKGTSMFSLYSVVDAIIFFLYFILMTKFSQQTLGKMIFGLRVVSLKSSKLTWSDVIFRELFGRYISKTLWISYVVVAFTKKKQGLHDLFAETSVILDRNR
ncbi:RDD family protein [Bacillus kexueae]|uniref:RDD family protein n=1 Tax=Aeribacillus kexueae TaxID=2078952 RepID=UPI001FAF90D9|nr:RDD family protein [Bacillus kexueae]